MSRWLEVASPYFAACTAFLSILLATCFWATSQAQSSQHSIELPYSPNNISKIEIFRLIVLLIIKTALPGFAPALKDGQEPGTFNLPHIEIKGKLRISEAHVSKFQHAVPESTNDERINPIFLFAQLNPLVVLLLAHAKCPIKPLGSVNTENTFQYLRPTACCDIMALKQAGVEGVLTYAAHIGSTPGARTRSGIKFSIVIELYERDRPLLRLTMWFMQFLRKSFKPTISTSIEPRQIMHKQDLSDRLGGNSFLMTPSDPKHWAASCKDYNPIHISKLGAAAFGRYPNVIAHGNHVLALVLQQRLGSVSTQATKELWHGDQPIELAVQFRSPLVLPAETTAAWSGTSRPTEDFLVLGKNNKEHLRGTLSIQYGH